MITNQNSKPAPGWVGGFAASNPAFAYPNPNLSSLPMLCNMANINLLQRQQGVEWPEFSWETEKGNPILRGVFSSSPPTFPDLVTPIPGEYIRSYVPNRVFILRI